MKIPALLSALAVAFSSTWSLSHEARAESWCAEPLWVHEWGVQVFGDPSSRSMDSALDLALTTGPSTSLLAAAVRDMPADSGERALPIVQFYTPGAWSNPVVGFGVGFREGDATSWYPQVEQWTAGADANSAESLTLRSMLEDKWATRPAFFATATLPADPSMQLWWHNLGLSGTGAPSAISTTPWVAQLRDIPGALWVNAGSTSERFLYYEAQTAELPQLSMAPAEDWSSERLHYILTNTSAYPVHDVLVIRNQDGVRQVYSAPTIPAGATNGLLLEGTLDDAAFDQATREQLRTWFVDSGSPAPPAEYRWDLDSCVMGRDPAVPTTTAEGYRLYNDEVEVMLNHWAPEWFAHEGVSVLYREDTSYLDAVMPLVIHTDMFHFIELRRLSVATIYL